MKEIGIITLWAKNYGSVLQCYAMRQIVKKLGYYPQVYFQNEYGVKKYINKVNTVGKLVGNSILYPSYFGAFRMMRGAGKKSINSLAKNSEKQLDFFVKHSIQPVGKSYSELKKIAQGCDTEFFICGSDQIWNGSVPYNKVSFLQFAPMEKRISYAPSFGTSCVENYNKKKYAKAISEIPYLSVREEEGIGIISELCNKVAIRLPDPTVLLTNAEWDDFSSKSQLNIHDYILIHFLDNPSSCAIKAIKELQNRTKLRLVTFGYPHKDSLGENLEHIDGNPYDYIHIIKEANYICTDSFHTSLFSIRYSKQFYVFRRQYSHGYVQSSRINTLLKNCNCQDRFIDGKNITYDNLPKAICNNPEFWEKERLAGIGYLSSILNKQDIASKKPNLKEESDCTGCGLCSKICKFNAIKMTINSIGAISPVVDKAKCVKCGQCSRVCHSLIFENSDIKKKAYIAYNACEADLLEAASGGVFAALAHEIISQQGIVYGATIEFGDEVKIEHKSAETFEELKPILKSKYVQSNCINTFDSIKKNLDNGRVVLFSGTSCQIAALKRFLGAEYTNLYTADLICHGVPGEGFFKSYLKYLEKANRSKVIDFSFRNKNNGSINYEETVIFESGKVLNIPWKKSNYYRQFLRCESYRTSCYQCEFASIDKPGDITIGDYFEAKNDYPELFMEPYDLNKIRGISCMIIQNNKGDKLICQYGKNLRLFPVSVEVVQNSHNQLCFPSRHTDFRKKLFQLYKSGGFYAINKNYRRRELVLLAPKKVYHFLTNLMLRKGK